jgi:lipopolysaccharide biosynthesis glycosyltransferase
MAQKKPTQTEPAASLSPQEQAALAVPPAVPATGPVHVAWCIDVQGPGAAQFADQLYVSVKSVRDTRTQGDSVVAHICYAHVSVELMERLHALDADGFKVVTRHITDQDLAYWQQFTRHDPRSAARPWGGIVFARIWLPLLLPNVDRCCYLDADTMCRAPIADLCNVELPEGKWLGMNIGSVPEYGYNSGVMVMDLKAMREDKTLYQRLGEFMAQHTRSFHCPDQTTINRFLADKITDIGREWNYPPTPGAADPAMLTAKLWHFYNGTQKPYRIAADDAGRALVEWNNMLS